MCALTINDHVFVLLEDPSAPTRADVLQNASDEKDIHAGVLHYRTTFLTVSPLGNLEQLLAQLRARWVPVRQTTNMAQRGQGLTQHLTIEGKVFAIGNDWLVRTGNVVLTGGAVKGMLLEVRCSWVAAGL